MRLAFLRCVAFVPAAGGTAVGAVAVGVRPGKGVGSHDSHRSPTRAAATVAGGSLAKATTRPFAAH